MAVLHRPLAIPLLGHERLEREVAVGNGGGWRHGLVERG
jgi:hypothetical protein